MNCSCHWDGTPFLPSEARREEGQAFSVTLSRDDLAALTTDSNKKVQDEMIIGSPVRIFDKDGLLYTEGVLLGVSRRKQTRFTNTLTLRVRCPLSPASVSGKQVMVEYQKDGYCWEQVMKLGVHTKVGEEVEAELHASEAA
jgi:hypothetical protein